MKTMKKAVGKKPMVKAKAGMSVGPSPEKKQARQAAKVSRQEARDVKRAGKMLNKGTYVPSEDFMGPANDPRHYVPGMDKALKARGMKKSGGTVSKPKAMYGTTMKSKSMMKKGGPVDPPKKNTTKQSMSPNTSNFTVTKDGSSTYKATNDKGKYKYISTSKSDVKGNDNKGVVYDKDKTYSAHGKPTLTISSKGSPYKGDVHRIGKPTVHYEKSMDTTGYSKGRKEFTEVSKTKVPGSGNMYKTTERTVSRNAVKPILDKMKSKASTPIKRKGGAMKTKKY